MSWVTTEICWYFHYSCCSKHLTSHACALLIDNVGNYLYMYLNNGSFKSEVDPHQFNLRERKKIFKSWQVCDWLAKWLIVLGFMDLRWPRVYRRSNVGLVNSLWPNDAIWCHGAWLKFKSSGNSLSPVWQSITCAEHWHIALGCFTEFISIVVFLMVITQANTRTMVQNFFVPLFSQCWLVVITIRHHCDITMFSPAATWTTNEWWGQAIISTLLKEPGTSSQMFYLGLW